MLLATKFRDAAKNRAVNSISVDFFVITFDIIDEN